MSKRRRTNFAALASAVLMAVAAVGMQGIGAQSPEPLGVEISTGADTGALYLPVSSPSQKNRLYATVPVTNGGEVSAVRVIPVMQGARVRVEVYAVSGDLTKAQSCADRLLLPSRLLATHTVEKNQTVTVAGEGWSANITAVERRPEQSDSPGGKGGGRTAFVKTSAQLEPVYGAEGCGCAGCAGGIRCCPNKGDCMQCPCGTVCCTGS